MQVLEPVGMVAMLVVAGGILSHTIHLGPFHWTVGLLLDIAIGAAVGLLLAGVLHAWHKLSGARNKG